MLKNIINLIKRFLGFSPGPSEEQKTEKLITMRERRDCHNAAVATACGVTYEQASKALLHWNLFGPLESPLISNPLNVCRGIRKLGFKADDKIKISRLLKADLPPGKVICLMHDPSNDISGTLNQHWVVWFGKNPEGKHLFHWGQYQELRAYTEEETIDMLTSGSPNCIILVSNV